MDANETGPPGNADGQAGDLTEREQPSNETASTVTIAGLLCKQISHMVTVAEKFPYRSRAWAFVVMTVGIWRRRVKIRRERRSP
jgi:hypothetical protein